MVLEYAERGYVFDSGKIAIEDTASNLLGKEEVKKLFWGYKL